MSERLSTLSHWGGALIITDDRLEDGSILRRRIRRGWAQIGWTRTYPDGTTEHGLEPSANVDELFGGK